MKESLFDFLFPPLCLHCKKRTPLSFFCEACWMLCSPLEPEERCQHCFTEWTDSDVCGRCKLPFLRAVVFEPTAPAKFLCREKGEEVAAFFLYQWIQMEWPIPDVVIPMPKMESVARAFAFFLNDAGVSCAPILSGSGWRWTCNEEVLAENQVILLLDEQSSLFTLKKAAQALLKTSPKNIFQLSLFYHIDNKTLINK